MQEPEGVNKQSVKKLQDKILKFLPIQGLEETELLKGAGISLIIKIIGACLAFGVNVLLARLLGVHDYGAYIYIYTWVTLIALPVTLGFDNGLVRFIPEYKSNEEWSDLKGFISFAFKTTGVCGLIVAGLAISCVFIFDDLIGNYDPVLVIIGAAIIPFLALLYITTNSLKGFKNVVGALAPHLIVTQLVVGFGTLTIYSFSQNVTATNVMFVTLVAISLALLTGLYLLKNKWPHQLNSIKSSHKKKYWLGVILPMLLIAGMTLVLRKTDLIMVGIFQGAESAGIYGAVINMTSLALFGPQAVNVIAASLFSELFYNGKVKKLQQVVTLASRSSFAITCIITLCFVIYGEFILSLFGAEFTMGYVALIILLIAILCNTFCGSVGFLLIMTGHQNLAAGIFGAAALLNIILNILFIPGWGMEGAAAATGISMILWNGLMILFVQKKLKINPTIL